MFNIVAVHRRVGVIDDAIFKKRCSANSNYLILLRPELTSKDYLDKGKCRAANQPTKQRATFKKMTLTKEAL